VVCGEDGWLVPAARYASEVAPSETRPIRARTPAWFAAVVVLAAATFAGCQRGGLHAELRRAHAADLSATPRYAVVEQVRVSTVPRPIAPTQRAAIVAGFHAAAADRGLVHDGADPQLAVIFYQESAAPRRPEGHPIRVDWRHGDHAGTYRYPLGPQRYPGAHTPILVCDVVRVSDGRLLRQLVDPDYFHLARLAAKDDAAAPPAGYHFPMGLLAVGSFGD